MCGSKIQKNGLQEFSAETFYLRAPMRALIARRTGGLYGQPIELDAFRVCQLGVARGYAWRIFLWRAAGAESRGGYIR
jgi:hypothetical protein